MEVVVARWPEQREAVVDLRRRGVPRLLVLADGEAPPAPVDGLEDFVVAGADRAELRARVDALRIRADLWGAAPQVAEQVVRFRQRSVSLSPVEEALAGALVERYGTVVTRVALAARAWPDGQPTRNALDVHVLRLRRRIEPLGLRITTVRSRGYLLQAAPPDETAPAASANG